MASTQEEFADALRDAHMPATLPTYVEARITGKDGRTHKVTRTLISDYAKRSDCQSALQIDGRDTRESNLADIGVMLSQPPLSAPVFAQHTLGYLFSARPRDRATSTDIEHVIEAFRLRGRAGYRNRRLTRYRQARDPLRASRHPRGNQAGRDSPPNWLLPLSADAVFQISATQDPKQRRSESLPPARSALASCCWSRMGCQVSRPSGPAPHDRSQIGSSTDVGRILRRLHVRRRPDPCRARSLPPRRKPRYDHAGSLRGTHGTTYGRSRSPVVIGNFRLQRTSYRSSPTQFLC